jgi:hypothetical protein
MGLVPIMWSVGTGANVMKRIAASMIGGIFTSFVLELVVYPAIYERVDVEMPASGAAIVSWIEFAQQRSQFRIRQVEPSGAGYRRRRFTNENRRRASAISASASDHPVSSRKSRSSMLIQCVMLLG